LNDTLFDFESYQKFSYFVCELVNQDLTQ